MDAGKRNLLNNIQPRKRSGITKWLSLGLDTLAYGGLMAAIIIVFCFIDLVN